MSVIVFLLSAVLTAAALGSAYLSLDLLPTGPGLLYAFSAAVAAVAAVLMLGVGFLIRRIDRLSRLIVEARAAALLPPDAPPRTGPAPPVRKEPIVEVVPAAPAPAGAQPLSAEPLSDKGPGATEGPPEGSAAPLAGAAPEAAPEKPDDPVNENRTGHLPSLAAIEHAIETPHEPPALIGRYTSGGTTYMIFADGSIEAETTDGTFTFPSMGDFKRYLAERRDAKA